MDKFPAENVQNFVRFLGRYMVGEIKNDQER